VEVLNIVDQQQPLDLEYDGDADVLYLSIGKPRRAVGVDIGDGLVVRYDELRQEVVGLTVIGLKRRLEKNLGSEPE
jgi:uncharacterized protein YuzE